MRAGAAPLPLPLPCARPNPCQSPSPAHRATALPSANCLGSWAFFRTEISNLFEMEDSIGVSGPGAMAPAMLTNMAVGAEMQPPLPPPVPAPASAQKSPMLYYSSAGADLPKVPGGVLSSPLASPLVVDNARRGPQPTFCEHQLPKSKCKKCKAMSRICKHGKKKELCRECDGSALCSHDLRKKVRPTLPAPQCESVRIQWTSYPVPACVTHGCSSQRVLAVQASAF